MRATRLASVSEQLIQLAQRLAVELELRGGSSQVTQLHLNLPELGAIMVRIAEIPGKLHVELIASREALRILAQEVMIFLSDYNALSQHNLIFKLAMTVNRSHVRNATSMRSGRLKNEFVNLATGQIK